MSTPSPDPPSGDAPAVVKRIDARGRSCPMPIVELARAAKQCAAGEHLEILATDPAFPEDVKAWCRKMSYQLVSLDGAGDSAASEYRAVVGKTRRNP